MKLFPDAMDRHALHAMTTPAQRRTFIWLCILNCVLAGAEMAVAGAVSLLGVAMASPASLERLPYFSQLIALSPLPATIPAILNALCLTMALVCLATLIKNILTAYVTWRQLLFSQNIAWHTGSMLYKGYLRAPYLWHLRQNSAELQQILIWKSTLAAYVTNLQVLICQLSVAVALVFGAFIAAPAMAGLLFGCIVLITLPLHKAMQSMIRRMVSRMTAIDLNVARTTLQSLHGIREVIIYDKKKAFHNEFTRIIPEYSRCFSTQALCPSIPQWVLESVGMLLLLVVICILSLSGASVATATGTLMLLTAIAWRLLPAANKTLGAILSIRAYMPYVQQIVDKLHETPALTTLTDRHKCPFARDIVLSGITFAYPDTDAPVIENLHIRIPKGSSVGLVGLSGSGKSTVSGLITGLLTPDSGDILVDGAPFDSSTNRLNIGYVPQSLYLSDVSLAENVAYSHWGEAVDRDRVHRCCAMASMDFVDELPEGIDTVLGERGVRLSGGQVQRVGIARALYDNPELLIFDEATSALDGAAELAIQKTISELRHSVTMLVIAHRLSTVEDCDIVVWLDKGKVIASGAPAEVLPDYKKFLAAAAQEGMCENTESLV